MGQIRRILRIRFLLDELFLLLSEVVHYVRMHNQVSYKIQYYFEG